MKRYHDSITTPFLPPLQPPDCKKLIEDIKSASVKSHRDLANFLKTVKIWTVGKCELYHWIDVLDIFDSILDHVSTFVSTFADEPQRETA